jgi:hypothetical protein
MNPLFRLVDKIGMVLEWSAINGNCRVLLNEHPSSFLKEFVDIKIFKSISITTKLTMIRFYAL